MLRESGASRGQKLPDRPVDRRPDGRALYGRGWLATAVLFLCIMGVSILPSNSQENRAETIVKEMSEYISTIDVISANIDTSIEVITPELQKIQFNSSGQVILRRPDKFRASRLGGYADVEFIFDGKSLTIHARDLNSYAQVEAPGSTDQLIDRLRQEFHLDAPGADLLLSNPHDMLMQDVLEATYIGHGVIGGIETEHLAFRGHDTDWQLWVEIGPHPIPRKLVITSKAMTGGPQYSLRIMEWMTDTQVGADTFTFKPPAGSRKIEARDLPHIDEVPPGILR
jgi:hypothetical protein